MVLDSGDTAWVLVSTAMVMLMIPGVGLFYGGLVRKKDVVSMIGLSFLALALVSVQWSAGRLKPLLRGRRRRLHRRPRLTLGLKGSRMEAGWGAIPSILTSFRPTFPTYC